MDSTANYRAPNGHPQGPNRKWSYLINRSKYIKTEEICYGK